MNYDVVVAGGRVAGSIFAYHAAKKGLRVIVAEKNPEIGVPVQCAGGVSDSFFRSMDIKPLPEFTYTRIRAAAINSPSGARIITENPIIRGYTIERKVFDRYLALRAAEAGADITVNTRVEGLLLDEGSVTGVNLRGPDGSRDVRCRMVIAADGISSRVARMAGLDTRFRPEDICSCAQYEMVGVDVEDDMMEFYFGSQVAPSGYLWVFPRGDGKANIGLGMRRRSCSERGPLHYLKRFTEGMGYQRTEFVAGAVPVGGPVEKTYTDGILVVGDAAGQVDPLTGGGIHIAAECAKIAADVSADAIESDRTDSEFLSEYQRRWYDKIGRNLKRSLKYRRVLDDLGDDELDQLIGSLEGKDLSSISKISLLKALREYPSIIKILKEML